jgi:hypothetical protein
MTTAGDDNFFRKKHTTTVAFGVAVLLFLLPFVEIRCNGMAIAKNTGIGLAVGSDYSLGNDMQTLKNQFDSDPQSKKGGPSKESGKVYAFALIALLLGIGGIALSFTKIKPGIINTVIGVAAALSLLALMVQLNSDIKEKAGVKEGSDFTDNIKVSIAFTIWYYLCIVSFLTAAFFSFKRGQILVTNGAPPPHAPQLDLENPGDQSEFPKSASESEVG